MKPKLESEADGRKQSAGVDCAMRGECDEQKGRASVNGFENRCERAKGDRFQVKAIALSRGSPVALSTHCPQFPRSRPAGWAKGAENEAKQPKFGHLESVQRGRTTIIVPALMTLNKNVRIGPVA